MLESIVQEPFLVLLLSITFINIILIAKVVAGRNRTAVFRGAGTLSNDLTTVIPIETELVIETGSKQPQQEEIQMPQDPVPLKSDNVERVVDEGIQMQGCSYCMAFYNVGTAVCPNCGSALNLNPQLVKVKAL
jgi:hypothetical protein